MSLEALLLFALFVLVPVLEQLITRARRRRADATTAETRAEPDVVPSLPVEPPTASASAAPVPEPPSRPPSLPRRLRNRSTTRRERLRRPDQLREAMIMRIVLGPCRARSSVSAP